MARAYYLNDSAGIFYPFAHTSTTFDPNGNNLTTILNDINAELVKKSVIYSATEPEDNLVEHMVWIE